MGVAHLLFSMGVRHVGASHRVCGSVGLLQWVCPMVCGAVGLLYGGCVPAGLATFGFVPLGVLQWVWLLHWVCPRCCVTGGSPQLMCPNGCTAAGLPG